MFARSSEIQQPGSKYFIVCLIFVISLCHMYIINSQLPLYSVLHGICVCILLLDTRQMNLSCANSAHRLLCGLRRVTKHASTAVPVSWVPWWRIQTGDHRRSFQTSLPRKHVNLRVVNHLTLTKNIMKCHLWTCNASYWSERAAYVGYVAPSCR